jgi:hypothetical protein
MSSIEVAILVHSVANAISAIGLPICVYYGLAGVT